MRLTNIRISAHRGLLRRELDVSHAVVAITGPPGSGKSSVLDVVTRHKEHVAPYGRPSSAADLLDGPTGTLEVQTEWVLDEEERNATGAGEEKLTATSSWTAKRGDATADPALAHILGRFQHGDAWGKIDLMPVSRVAPPGMPTPGDPVMALRRNRLGARIDKYDGLVRAFVAASDAERSRVSELLVTLSPAMHAGVKDDKLVFETPRGSRTLRTLSMSNRLAFLFAATVTLVGLQRSVMLIDTPELGLPPGGALALVRAIKSFAPDTQLIMATTDRDILAARDISAIHLEEM